MVGNINKARLVRDFYSDADGWDSAPPGFTLLGNGVYRVAVKDNATKTVYKFGSSRCNVNDERNSLSLRNPLTTAPFPLAIPRARHFESVTDYVGHRTVLAMEYAEGAEYSRCEATNYYYSRGAYGDCDCGTPLGVCHAEVIRRIASWANISDLHEENVLWAQSTNTYWLVDMGE